MIAAFICKTVQYNTILCSTEVLLIASCLLEVDIIAHALNYASLFTMADKKFIQYCYFQPAFSEKLNAVEPAKREFGPALAGAGRLFRPL